MNETIIENMLKQPIEPQLGDSGFYGYAYEKRQNINYEQTQIYNKDGKLSLYHLFTKCLDSDYLTNEINELLSENENIMFEIVEVLEEMSTIDEYYELKEFVNELEDIEEDTKEQLLKIFRDLLSDEFFTLTDNTYNFYNVLEGVFQFRSFGDSEKTYILLRTHNGADIRGGYSDWGCFVISDNRFDEYMTGIEKLE